ncbi:MAG: demethoxyubiquinone hydroxylase family protein [Gammaproteobacteria bacterium]|nr:demethoxyubiquinone hydroxylase family protein [Gammaproteobacteria bacterium]
MRSDHAGETGAVFIYKGILSLARDSDLRQFATEHLQTEVSHLDLITALLPASERSLLLPLWRLAGFLTGAIPALFGASAVYATIEAVESFVDHHYQEQIDRLRGQASLQEIAQLLESCRQDEIKHRDEARSAQVRAPGPLLRAWCWLVGIGSKMAVTLARWR